MFILINVSLSSLSSLFLLYGPRGLYRGHLDENGPRGYFLNYRWLPSGFITNVNDSWASGSSQLPEYL